jgi:hypothetical protein
MFRGQADRDFSVLFVGVVGVGKGYSQSIQEHRRRFLKREAVPM